MYSFGGIFTVNSIRANCCQSSFGNVDFEDKISNWMIEAGLSGYINSDLNLDKQVNNIDKNDFWHPNVGKGSMLPD